MRATVARTARFVERVFTAQERDYCTRRGAVAAQHFAARFAAKEAFLKALGTGWRDGIAWHDVEVVNQASGAPALIITGKAREIYDQLGVTAAHLSLSHTAEHAIAQVILEK
jgi:holo-[acyl-carrier protein] synthase